MATEAPRKRLHLQPIEWREACAFVGLNHSHHEPPQGWKFGIACNVDDERVVGVITVGRPVSRIIQEREPYTIEITRCCTDRTRHVASKLYGSAIRASLALGYRRVITYTLKEEAGTSLIAAGFRVVYQTEGGSWDTPSRPRVDTAPIGQKTLWEVVA